MLYAFAFLGVLSLFLFLVHVGVTLFEIYKDIKYMKEEIDNFDDRIRYLEKKESNEKERKREIDKTV